MRTTNGVQKHSEFLPTNTRHFTKQFSLDIHHGRRFLFRPILAVRPRSRCPVRHGGLCAMPCSWSLYTDSPSTIDARVGWRILGSYPGSSFGSHPIRRRPWFKQERSLRADRGLRFVRETSKLSLLQAFASGMPAHSRWRPFLLCKIERALRASSSTWLITNARLRKPHGYFSPTGRLPF